MPTKKSTKKSSKKQKSLKVALVHDYLREYGGAERVVEALHTAFPDSPLYVAFTDKSVTGIHWHKFSDWDIRESWITKIPGYKNFFSPLRIFAPWYFSNFDLSRYDVVISSTNAYFSKAVTVGDAVHIVYCHTPARSLYGYSTMTNWKQNPFTRFAGTLLNHFLRIKDIEIARTNVDRFVANSQETARRIQKFYRLDSTVIYPPIVVADVKKLSKVANKPKQDGYFLVVGRLAASKHVDLAVMAATELGLNLKVVGTGKGLEYLRSLAGDTVEFLGAVSDEKLAQLYAGATALLYPAEDEDFGMVPIEAMGYGIPVIAHKSGGPLETIQEGKNGYFFEEFTVASLGSAVEKLLETKWNKQKIYEFAQSFNTQRFITQIQSIVKETYEKGKRKR